MSGESHVERADGLDSQIVACLKPAIILLKTMLEETVPELHHVRRGMKGYDV
jgi:hypothetical protein